MSSFKLEPPKLLGCCMTIIGVTFGISEVLYIGVVVFPLLSRHISAAVCLCLFQWLFSILSLSYIPSSNCDSFRRLEIKVACSTRSFTVTCLSKGRTSLCSVWRSREVLLQSFHLDGIRFTLACNKGRSTKEMQRAWSQSYSQVEWTSWSDCLFHRLHHKLHMLSKLFPPVKMPRKGS